VTRVTLAVRGNGAGKTEGPAHTIETKKKKKNEPRQPAHGSSCARMASTTARFSSRLSSNSASLVAPSGMGEQRGNPQAQIVLLDYSTVRWIGLALMQQQEQPLRKDHREEAQSIEKENTRHALKADKSRGNQPRRLLNLMPISEKLRKNGRNDELS
jgi:hypothetical protein